MGFKITCLNKHAFVAILVSLLALATSACTVQPLHSNAGSREVNAASIFIEPVGLRVEQQIRNRLIFLLNGGEAQPSNPRFRAEVSAKSATGGVLSVQRPSGDTDLSASRQTISATLTIKDGETGKVVKTYTRQRFSSYDNSSQRFANQRALIDAENRAASEIAEEFRTLVLSFVPSAG